MDTIEQYHKRNAEMFEKLYPELENIEISYADQTYGHTHPMSPVPMPKAGLMEGKYIRCSAEAESCTGKYDLYGLIREAIDQNFKETEPRTLSCSGYYRKLKRDCERSISVSLKLIYKA